MNLAAHSCRIPEIGRGQGQMKKGRTRYGRYRMDSGQHQRILLVMVLLGLAAFVPLGIRLWMLMIRDYDYYAGLALRNQTRTTAVTAERGDIYDRNMNILASSVGVENVYITPYSSVLNLSLNISPAESGKIYTVPE